MRKEFKYYAIVWSILFLLFNIIVFVTPAEAAGFSKYSGAFWPGYIFISLSFIGQLLCAVFAFKNSDIKKVFLNLPLVDISYSALLISVIFGTLCMTIPNLPVWLGIIVSLLILGFSSISVISAKAAAEIVSNREDTLKTEISFIRTLTADAKNLLDRAKTAEQKTVLLKVYETIRYSDPKSTDTLASIEGQISVKFNALSTAVSADSDSVLEIAEALVLLLNERNQKCKLLK